MGGSDNTEVPYKTSVEVIKPQEMLKLLPGVRDWPLLNSLGLSLVRLHLSTLKDVTQESDR